MTEELQTELEAAEAPREEASANVDDEMQKPIYNKVQMSDVVKREKQKAFERGKREALMELQQQQQAQLQPEQQQMQAPQMQPVMQQAMQGQSLGGMQQMSPADIERMIAEKAPQVLQNHVNELRTRELVNSFTSKMQAAETKYPGLSDKLNDLDYSSMAPVVELANRMENTADIMHELVNHPMKMGNILTLMYTQPKLAERAMGELSASIKQNEQAKAEEAQARDPMSQLKPSMNAGLDNGNMSVSDIRKAMLSGKY